MMKVDYISHTSQFKKDYKKVKKQHRDLKILEKIVTKLANLEEIDARFLDHALSGNNRGYRELHLNPDWLLMYKYKKSKNEKLELVLVLSRLGSHAELFKM